jgi:hypothetical protein
MKGSSQDSGTLAAVMAAVCEGVTDRAESLRVGCGPRLLVVLSSRSLTPTVSVRTPAGGDAFTSLSPEPRAWRP